MSAIDCRQCQKVCSLQTIQTSNSNVILALYPYAEQSIKGFAMRLTNVSSSRKGRVSITLDVGDVTLVSTSAGFAIEWLWIVPDKRNCGLGREALKFIRQIFAGVLEPVLVVDSAMPFWKKMAREGYCTYFPNSNAEAKKDIPDFPDLRDCPHCHAKSDCLRPWGFTRGIQRYRCLC